MKFSGNGLRLVGGAWLFASLCMICLTGCGGNQPETGPVVTIRWSPSTSDVVGYNVYRVSPGGVPGKLSTQIVRDTKFLDTTVEVERFYSYFITSVNAKGLESEPSERVDIRVPKPELTSALSRFFARIRGARSSTPVP